MPVSASKIVASAARTASSSLMSLLPAAGARPASDGRSLRVAQPRRRCAPDVLEEAPEPRVRPGRPTIRQCSPTDIIRPPALGVELVERVDQVLAKSSAVTKPFRSRNLKSFASSVYGTRGVRPSASTQYGQVVGVGVGVVEEAAPSTTRRRVPGPRPVYHPTGREAATRSIASIEGAMCARSSSSGTSR